MLKDYYQILEISPGATLPEIKRAYRSLAMTYHPDKNPGDRAAAIRFSDIKEAYEVLTTPAKKEFYLQQRWYNHSIGRKRTSETITPVSVLRNCLELEKYVSRLDIHRMDKEGLSRYVDELLRADTIQSLTQWNEPAINRQIITTVLTALKPLPLPSTASLLTRLTVLAGDDEEALQRIRKRYSELKKEFLWNRYKILVIALFTLLICLLIFFTSR